MTNEEVTRDAARLVAAQVEREAKDYAQKLIEGQREESRRLSTELRQLNACLMEDMGARERIKGKRCLVAAAEEIRHLRLLVAGHPPR